MKFASSESDSLVFHLLDLVAVLLVCAFEFIYHFFTPLRQNFFVVDELINEGQVPLNGGFVFLSLDCQPLFRVFLHLLRLSKCEFTLLVLIRECKRKKIVEARNHSQKILSTVEPRSNKPLYNEVLGITNDLFQPREFKSL